jgi:hypothetical protein
MHWIDERESAGEEAVCKLMPATIATLQPFSDKTIRLAINALRAEELIVTVQGKQCLFSGPKSRSKVDETRSKVDIGRSKVDKGRSKVDNNSYCSSFVESLEESSKRQAPPASCELSSCDKKQHAYNHTGLGCEVNRM